MQSKLAHYTCYRTAGPIAIDGKLNELSWLAPPSSSRLWISSPASLRGLIRAWRSCGTTRAFISDSLPRSPRCAGTLTERDSKIYEDNDMEVFIAGEDAYYEFEINALNTIYEVFWIWKDALQPGDRTMGVRNSIRRPSAQWILEGVGGHVHPRGERWGFLDWDFPGLRHAVHVERPGWTVELALPWKGLVVSPTAVRFRRARGTCGALIVRGSNSRPGGAQAGSRRGLDLEPAWAL